MSHFTARDRNDDDSSEEENEADRSLLGKAYQNMTINEEQIEKLPRDWKLYYKNTRQSMRDNLRRKVLHKNHSFKALEIKMKSGQTLNEREMSFYEANKRKVTNMESPEVEVEAVDLLDDVVKGDYTLTDVHLVREGAAGADKMDPVENSPLLLLDSLIESALEQTHEALQTKEPGNFFSLPTTMEGNFNPGQMSDAIKNAATAVGIMQGSSKIEQNDAKSSIDSYIITQVMHEAEVKLKQIEELSQDKNILEDQDSLEETKEDEAKATSTPRISFNVTELNYEVSMLPSVDPDVYKPLEIISFIGMTENTSN